MPATFYTPSEKQLVHDRAVEVSVKHVEAYYADLGGEFGRALFFTCMRLWEAGPAITAARLNSNARKHIVNAWRWSELLAGVLLKKKDGEYIPLFLQKPTLAQSLSEKGDLWVDFSEIRKELGL